jgi:hypothetical protein
MNLNLDPERKLINQAIAAPFNVAGAAVESAITAPFKPDADPLSVVTAVPVAITVAAAKQMEALAAQATRAAFTFPFRAVEMVARGVIQPKITACSQGRER